MHDFLVMSYREPVSPCPRKPQRAVTKADKPVIVYMPVDVVNALDHAARSEDSDRSKLVRRAVRNLLTSLRAS